MKIGIVGAGITGMASAYYLSKMGHEVNVFDERDRAGGLARNFEFYEDTSLETHPMLFCKSDSQLIKLLSDFDLHNQVIWKNVRTGVFFSEQILAFTNIADLYRFPGLSFINKTKSAVSALKILLTKDWEKMDKIPAKEWIIRNCGAKTYENIWQNILECRFKGYAHAATTAWFWAMAKKRIASSSLLGMSETAGYFEESTKIIFDSLNRSITRNGGSVFTGHKATKIDISSNKVKGLTANDRYFRFDRIILTVPVNEIKKIAKEAFVSLPEKIRQLEYATASTLILELKRQFSEYFKLKILDPAIPFCEIIEPANMRGQKFFRNRAAIYIPNYIRETGRLINLDKQSLIELYTPGLKRINKNFSETEIIGSHLFVDRNAEPYCFPNYSSAMADFRTAVRELFMANSSQIYPWPRRLDSCIANAQKLSEIAG